MKESWSDRTELLLGKDKMQRLRDAHVLVVGVGGVGAYAAEMLCRAGVGEMTLIDEVETAVSIDEAVELAKKYGTAQSPRFINGVLGSIAKDLTRGESFLSSACANDTSAKSLASEPVVGTCEGSRDDGQD